MQLPVLAPRPPRVLHARALDEHTLFAALVGRTEVVCDGRRHVLQPGSSLWTPATSVVRMRRDADAVVVPIIGVPGAGPAAGVAGSFALDWEPAILHAFGSGLGYLDGPADRALPGGAGAVLHPPMPVTPALVVAARAIVAEPAVRLADVMDRVLVGWSTRTVQRRFVAETGVTPSEWQRRTRAAAAAVLLEAGHDVEWVAHTVGYAEVSGFIRMFREVTGRTPGAWGTGASAGVALADRPPALATLAPRRRTWPRINGAHVAVWLAHGTATVLVEGRPTRLAPGDAVVLPAGLRNEVLLDDGAVLLPVGYRSGSALTVGEPRVPARFGMLDRPALVRAAVDAYLPLRDSPDPGIGFDLVLSRLETEQVASSHVVVASLASAVALAASAEPSPADAAGWIGSTEGEVRAALQERCGLTFAQWLRLSRMTRARAHLHAGATAADVSRGLGYAHLPAFSRAFRAVHGRPPREVDDARRTA